MFRKEIELNIKPMSKKEISVRFGRKKGFYNRNYVNYKKSLFTLLRSQLGNINIQKEYPIALDIEFYSDKIKIVISTIEDKMLYNTKRPDIDNLLKPLLDELKYSLGIDDSRFVKITASKLK